MVEDSILQPSPSEYFFSLYTETRILLALAQMPLDVCRNGGFTQTELSKQLKAIKVGKGTGFVTRNPLKKKLEELINADFVEPGSTRQGKLVYKCKPQTIIAIRLFDVESPKLKVPDALSQYSPQPSQTTLNHRFAVEVPGATILAGDHAALLGEPAVVLPIPLYLRAAMDLVYTPEPVEPEEVHVHSKFCEPWVQLEFDELKQTQCTPQPIDRIEDARTQESARPLQELFHKKLLSRIHEDG